MPKPTCSMPDCESAGHLKGKCRKHYEADRRAANPESVRLAQQRYRDKNRERLNAENRERKAKNRERYRVESLAYYYRTRETHIARLRAAYLADPEAARARMAKYREANRQKCRDADRRWRLANPDKKRALTERYRVNNPDKMRQKEAIRRAKKRGTNGFLVTPKDIQRLELRYSGRCAYCETPLKRGYHLDHVVPLVRGGSHSIGNLVPACQPCNSSKGPRTVVEWKRRQLQASNN